MTAKDSERNMDKITFIDRITGRKEVEKVYGERFLKLLYDHKNAFFSKCLLALTAKNPFASALFGWWQRQRWTARNIAPFIQKYGVDAQEFQNEVADFHSFNDFFIRRLKAEARPLAPGENVAIIPADGRYLFYPDIDAAEGFIVKGQKFQLADLLLNESLAAAYKHGTMVLARLCPTDYHRFHFCCDCLPSPSLQINGWLYSVNPMALRKNIAIFTENKRTISQLATKTFGTIIAVEIGATAVGTIVQTYTPNQPYRKGDEKGYFSFGGSSLILLFPPNTIQLDSDLIAATTQGLEIKCLMGQSLGKAL